ncbi:hypothetical protein [Microbacterium azadirachtae]|uniref:hypothetical protein n=1 Tax=Microbacterium azadirachtae TaxID=582680 RepID=UPI0008868F92|nr:hypothetical protein [Microbacterium azadirachtae]SDL91531.1 hypothetical protein SAMN04488593_2149 [Microbacterium azadirachtae]SEG16314.1 hypothetical protein SAMN04488594_2030 [Microbacterium azadirachtae]SEG18807.1 hypothetical protein SAMN04488592_2040 [Microbacterium azadirachtae]
MSDHDEPATQSIMARFDDGWPDVIDVGPGWHALLAKLDHELTAIDRDYVVQQVKSKFGALSFYAQATNEPDEYNEAFRQTIRDAEWASTTICEECGEPARTYTIRMWVWTLCDEHAQAKCERTAKRRI